MRFFAVCAVLALSGCSKTTVSTEAGSRFPPVTVHVDATPFTRVPDSVTIFAESPQEKHSSMPLMIDAPTVRLFAESGTLYCIQDVTAYNKSLGTKFVDGDMVYIYACDSLLAEEQLLGNHGFRRVNDPEKYHGLYEVRAHVFVEIGTDRRIQHFNCSMHPMVKVGQKGNCPICGMELMAVETHQGGAQPEN